MIDVLQKLIDQTKDRFENYLLRNGRTDLLPKVGELFDYQVKGINEHINVAFKLNGKEFLSKNINDIEDIVWNLEKLVPKKRKEQKYVFNISYLSRNLLDDVVYSDLNSIVTWVKQNKELIYNKIGIVEVQLVHNKSKQLVTFKTRIEEFGNLGSKIEQYKELIYEEYVQKKQRYYGDDGDVSAPIVDILTGNFIIDEFDNFLSDEYGNFVTFE